MENKGGKWCSRLFAKQEPIKLGVVRVHCSPQKKQGSWGVRSPRFVWDEENSQVRILPTLLKIVMCPSGLGTILI